jgi:hypothetical protein
MLFNAVTSALVWYELAGSFRPALAKSSAGQASREEACGSDVRRTSVNAKSANTCPEFD